MAPQEQSKDATISTLASSKSPGFRGYPTNRNVALKSAQRWLNGKKTDDNIGQFWRIHNGIFDLTDFVSRHPGGRFWIEGTRGLDITEVFESSHISRKAEELLPKYYLKAASQPRNSPYTFHSDGFYCTLKRRVDPILAKVGLGPHIKMKLIFDSLFFSFIALFAMSAIYQRYVIALFAGVLLGFVAIVSHNFSHQKDNWRMYAYDLSLLSSYEWRITHTLSHHSFPNTLYDFEITTFEPIFLLLPTPGKSWIQKYGSLFTSHLVYIVGTFYELFKRVWLIGTGNQSLRAENLLPCVELAIFVYVYPTFWSAYWAWTLMHYACSYVFLFIGVTAAHHHPELYHHGDKMRPDSDWGLCQLDAVSDRKEITGSILLSSVLFGDHALHHLFPTVDHSKLHYLYPELLRTCKEFDVPFRLYSYKEIVWGCYAQMMRGTTKYSFDRTKEKGC